MTNAPHTCNLCHRPYIRFCNVGECEYSDGSSRVCPNWNKRLDEIGGMTPAEADKEENYRRQFR